MNKITFIFLALIINFSLLTLTQGKTQASGFSVGVYPPIVKIEAKAPVNKSFPVFIQNFGNEPLLLQIQFKPFSPLENGGISFIPRKDFKPEDPLIFQKIKVFDQDLEVKEISIAPNQKKNLDIFIDLPNDEAPSDYYFSVLFVSKEPPTEKSNISEAKGAIAMNVLLSIGPKGQTTGQIDEFSVPFLLEKGPIPFKIRIKNTSKHFITARSQILITNMFGQTIGKVEIPPTNVLSESVREIADKSSAWPESFILGPYKATLTVSLSNDGPVFTRTARFIGAPFQAVISLTAVIIAAAFIGRKVRKKLS